MDARENPMVVAEANDDRIKIAGVDGSHTKQALQDIAFGSIAGVIGKFVEYPFDTIKVRLQSQPQNVPLQYNGPLDCFRQSWQRDGVKGLYRGISAPIVGAAIETSSLFFSYRVAQDILQSLYYKNVDPLPIRALLFCGAASGAVTSVLLTPIELIKCKMQVPADKSGITRAPGPLQLIANVFRQQGVLGFWHGQLGTLIRETGGSAAWFGSFEGMSLMFRNMRAEGTDQKSSLPIHQQLLAGAMAGMAYNFVFYPADTIKSRMQTEDISTARPGGARNTFLSVGRDLWRDQGLKGLYRGCGITVGRAAPSSALIFTIYEGLKQNFA